MAAGMGSRYGGLKQLEPVGPAGESMTDYAVFDAWRAGARRAVFVVRREMQAEFHARLGRRYETRLEVAYAVQELEGRAKPWGTGHAVLAAEGQVRAPFIVCNADDFYGAEGFGLLAAFLARPAPTPPERYAMVAFELRRTLSDHGHVSRGVCALDGRGLLAGVREYTHVAPHGEGARDAPPAGAARDFDGREPVSLNLWGLRPSVFPELRARFERFRAARADDPRAEFYLPAVIDALLREGRASVAVLRTGSDWFGLTHPEDRAAAQARLVELHARGDYPPALWP